VDKGNAVVPAAVDGGQYELVVLDPASRDAPIGCDADVEEGETSVKQHVVASKEKRAGCCKSEPTAVVGAEGAAKGKPVSREVQIEVISTIFIGDFFHNFSDGIFIGAAFQTCSSTVAWTIVLSTVFHEFAQEIADFIVLTKKGKLSICQALTVNAISGLSVVIGGIVIGVQEMKQSTIGLLLAFGAGNYIYLAATELYPAFHDFSNPKHKLLGLLLFAVGAAAVGLVLLDHEHCEAESHDSHSH
jgi:zinc transporter ZupT